MVPGSNFDIFFVTCHLLLFLLSKMTLVFLTILFDCFGRWFIMNNFIVFKFSFIFNLFYFLSLFQSLFLFILGWYFFLNSFPKHLTLFHGLFLGSNFLFGNSMLNSILKSLTRKTTWTFLKISKKKTLFRGRLFVIDSSIKRIVFTNSNLQFPIWKRYFIYFPDILQRLFIFRIQKSRVMNGWCLDMWNFRLPFDRWLCKLSKKNFLNGSFLFLWNSH